MSHSEWMGESFAKTRERKQIKVYFMRLERDRTHIFGL